MTPAEEAIALLETTPLTRYIRPRAGFRFPPHPDRTIQWCPAALLIDFLPYPNPARCIPSTMVELWLHWPDLIGALVQLYDESPTKLEGKRRVIAYLEAGPSHRR